ncbi:MAG TPA: hypothetical protein PKJ41_20565, partial [Bryobacteraceae bacterium]|nr:hypothetical protein [Bryobacteraceae bacterium]
GRYCRGVYLKLRMITSIAGVSEFTMRLAALGGAALYLWTLVKIGSRLFSGTWLHPATVILLGAAPLIMDFQVAARGYGLALALFLFGLERLTSALLAEPGRKDLWVAGAAMGFSIGTNLVFLLPVTAALGAFLYLWAPPARAQDAPRKHRKSTPRLVGRYDLVTAFAAAMLVFFMLAPVKHMLHRDRYYVGHKTLALSLTDLGATTLAHNEGIASLNMPAVEHDAVQKAFGMGVFPAILLIGFVAGWRMRRHADVARRGVVLFYYSAIAIASWALLIAMHLIAGFPYPADRTGIYLLPLFLFVLLTMAACEPRAFKLGAGALVVMLAVSFGIQFQTSHFRVWRYDAETRPLVEELNRRGVQAGRPMIAGITWLLQPSVVFYQTTKHMKFFDYAVRDEMRPGLDAYWLASEDWGLIEKYHLRTVRAMSVSQILVAEPGERR